MRAMKSLYPALLLASTAACTKGSAEITSLNRYEIYGEEHIEVNFRTNDGGLGRLSYDGDSANSVSCHVGDHIDVRRVGPIIEPIGYPCVPRGED